MTLLEDIQQAAIDKNSDVATLLRKCKLLAARLGSHTMEEWVLWESNGYPEGVSVPDYRIWPLTIKGDFFGPYGAAIKNASVQLSHIPEEAREGYEAYECRNSVGAIETMLQECTSGVMTINIQALSAVLGGNVYKGYNCLSAWAEFGKMNLVSLLDAVRNRVLDLSIALWKELPLAGEGSTGSPTKAVSAERATQIFNTVVHGGSATVVGTAIKSIVGSQILTGDFISLAKFLDSHGVSAEDIKELRSAVETESQMGQEGRFGPRVAGWLAKMMKKAAEGSWQIALGAAGELLAAALTRYYG
jgi:AbiTii